MKRCILDILKIAVLSLLVCGCSAVQVKSETGRAIDGYVGVLRSQDATTQPAAALAYNATLFNALARQATVNPWCYWFGPKKILCTLPFYQGLRGKAARAEEYARRAETQPAAPQLPELLYFEYVWMLDLQAQKNARPAWN